MKDFKEVNKECRKLFNEGKWEEVLKTVDENISSFVQPRKENGIDCYQFLANYDIKYFNYKNPNFKFIAAENYELILLYYKCNALMYLGESSQLSECLDVVYKISPDNVYFSFLNVNRFIYEGRLKDAEFLLNKIYPFIWKYEDFSLFLYQKALCRTYSGPLMLSRILLSWAMNYTKLSINNLDFPSLLEHVGLSQVNYQRILPAPIKALDGLNDEKLTPSKENLDFALNLYNSEIENKNENSLTLYSELKENAAKLMYKTAEEVLLRNKPEDKKLLDLDQIINSEKLLKFDFESKRLLPFIDAHDNSYICYDLANNNWCKFNTVKESKLAQSKDLSELILEK